MSCFIFNYLVNWPWLGPFDCFQSAVVVWNPLVIGNCLKLLANSDVDNTVLLVLVLHHEQMIPGEEMHSLTTSCGMPGVMVSIYYSHIYLTVVCSISKASSLWY